MAKGKDKPKKETKKPKQPKEKPKSFVTDNSNSDGPVINFGEKRDPRRMGRVVITG